MSDAARARARIDTDRWVKPIVIVLAIAAGYFGVVPFLLPELGAQSSGFAGRDIYIYRLTGAGSFGYTVALVLGWRDGWRGLRIPIAAMAVFAVGSIVACVLAIIGGQGTWIVYLVLVASSLFLALHLLLLSDPPSLGDPVGSGERDVADWVRYLIAFAGLAALGTGGLALVLGGQLGVLLGGYSGTDSIVYRQAGAATLGWALVGYLSLRSGRWVEMRAALAGGLAFNALSLIATLIEMARPGGINLLSILTLAVTVIVTVGFSLAFRRGGR